MLKILKIHLHTILYFIFYMSSEDMYKTQQYTRAL